MIDFSYKVLERIDEQKYRKVYTLMWIALRILCNLFYPLECKIKKPNTEHQCNEITDKEVIVSFTTFPARFHRIRPVIETLIRQSVKPTKIVLWLAENQFRDRSIVDKEIGSYYKYGVEVRYCEDLRAHKKYYYSILENPEAIVITVDDDILYPSFLVEKLLLKHMEYPNCVVANRAHYMKRDENGLLSYEEWDHRARGKQGPSEYLIATGCGGCLYPPKCFSDHIFEKEVLKSICLLADDIWLKCMEYLVGTKVVLTGVDNPEMIDLIGNKKTGLAQVNIGSYQNDEQMKAVSNHYNIIW